ncbi:MAG: acyl-CoA dehydrogenase family protein [Candidatus Binatia bacterium]
MDLSFGEQHESFRAEAREWIETNLDQTWSEALRDPANDEHALVELRRSWQRKLYEAGYLGMRWPAEWGGRGATEVEEAILAEELARADAPESVNGLGLGLCAPALIHHGSEEQRRRFIPPMLTAEEIWCQGFSEPGAGSDLAALRLKAELDGDDFVLNGQKCWTTYGPWADWIFVLARTDPTDRYGGISFLLVDLASEGVEMRPLRQITGESEFGEVFFDNVRVHRSNLVGEMGEGWRIAMTVLGYERGAITLSSAARLGRDLSFLVRSCDDLGLGDSAHRRELAEVVVEWQALAAVGHRTLADLSAGKAPGAESSIQKLMWSELDQRLRTVALEILGKGGQLLRTTERARPEVDWPRNFLWARAETIFSGSSEIQRNIIAKRVLGLPQN